VNYKGLALCVVAGVGLYMCANKLKISDRFSRSLVYKVHLSRT